MESSAAMTKTMRDDAEVMHGLGPVPLLQRQSAVESRWTRTVPTSRESARKAFRKVRFCPHQKWMPPCSAHRSRLRAAPQRIDVSLARYGGAPVARPALSRACDLLRDR